MSVVGWLRWSAPTGMMFADRDGPTPDVAAVRRLVTSVLAGVLDE